MLEPFAHKHETPVDPVAVGGVVRIRDDGAHFGLGGGFELFVGIENENPLVAEWEVLEGPVFLFGPSAIEIELHDFGTHRSGDVLRAIRARRINHKHLISPRDRRKATRQIGGLVLDRNDDGKGNFAQGAKCSVGLGGDTNLIFRLFSRHRSRWINGMHNEKPGSLHG